MTPSLRGRIEGIVALVGEIKVPDATERILLAVKEALPEKRDFSYYGRDAVVFNEAIEEMERRLDLGTEPTNQKS